MSTERCPVCGLWWTGTTHACGTVSGNSANLTFTLPPNLDDGRANRIAEREADYLSPDEQAFLAAERAAETQTCPACGGTGVRG